MRKIFAVVLCFTAAIAIGADTLPGAKTSIRTLSVNDVQTQLSDGAATYVGAKTGQLPAALGQTTKSGSVSVTLASDQGALATTATGLPAALGQTTKANSTSVTLASDQGALSVTNGLPSGQAVSRATPVNIASAATTAIVCKGSLAISQPLKVYRIRATGFALARCTARYNDNGAFTNWGDLTLSATSPHDEIQLGGFGGLTTSATATTQQIELNCTNFDSVAQDFGCDVSYCQSASGC